jgi:hypothetical protein
VALRVGMPLLGVAALCTDHKCEGDLGGIGVAIGLASGAVIAMLIDDIGLAWSEVPVKKTAWKPSIAVTNSSATVGFGVTF